MIGLLPPAGEPVCIRSEGDDFSPVPGYQHRFYQSGTAALAAAMCMVRKNRPDLTVPEVLVPAWGCPDLITAALYAGLKPVLVDVQPDFHGFDEHALKEAVSEQCAAILLVNYLGIHERRQFWRQFRDQRRPDIVLIEDNAQWWPEADEAGPLIYGDLSICSFGRGKPVSLLGGGCLFKRADCEQPWPEAQAAEAGNSSFLKMRLFNLLLHPLCYRVLDVMPGLNLGQTVYHPLEGLSEMDAGRRSLLLANIRRHEQKSREKEVWWRDALTDVRGITLAADRAQEGVGRLLRMPVLLEQPSQRDAVVALLKRAGIGATAMYAKPLHQIEGVAEAIPVMGAHFPAAAHYAGSMLTLPVHSGLSRQHVDEAAGVLRHTMGV